MNIRKKGFTIIELVIVIAIIGILTAIIITDLVENRRSLGKHIRFLTSLWLVSSQVPGDVYKKNVVEVVLKSNGQWASQLEYEKAGKSIDVMLALFATI